MPSNPIQQRIELICEKWEDAKVEIALQIEELKEFLIKNTD